MTLEIADERSAQDDTRRMHPAQSSFDSVNFQCSSAPMDDLSEAGPRGDTSDVQALIETFQAHWRHAYAAMEKTFSDYTLAYIFGFSLVDEDHCRDEPWEDIEPSVRSYWAHYKQDRWEEVEAAIQFGREVALQLACPGTPLRHAPPSTDDFRGSPKVTFVVDASRELEDGTEHRVTFGVGEFMYAG